jgi:hypothetical protein
MTALDRRTFLKLTGAGAGSLALGSLNNYGLKAVDS